MGRKFILDKACLKSRTEIFCAVNFCLSLHFMLGNQFSKPFCKFAAFSAPREKSVDNARILLCFSD